MQRSEKCAPSSVRVVKRQAWRLDFRRNSSSPTPRPIKPAMVRSVSSDRGCRNFRRQTYYGDKGDGCCDAFEVITVCVSEEPTSRKLRVRPTILGFKPVENRSIAGLTLFFPICRTRRLFFWRRLIDNNGIPSSESAETSWFVRTAYFRNAIV